MQALQDHETVIIDAVVAGTEKFSEVAGMNRGTMGAEVTMGGNVFHARAPATEYTTLTKFKSLMMMMLY